MNRNDAEAGRAVTLFPARILGSGVDNFEGRQYDVTRDDRFVINTVLDDGSSSMTLLQNGNQTPRKIASR